MTPVFRLPASFVLQISNFSFNFAIISGAKRNDLKFNKMKFKISWLLLMAILVFSFGCKQNRLKIDISGIDENIEIIRFDEQLFELPLQDTLGELLELREQNPTFFDLFTYKIIKTGGIGDPDFPFLISSFLTDTLIHTIKSDVEQEFSQFEKIAEELNNVFKHYLYYFPEKEMPVVCTYISGFNQSVVTSENLVGIGLDKYLGKDYPYYRQLSTTPQYKIVNMHKKKIVSDVAYAWASMEFEQSQNVTNLLGNMIYQGKLMYFVDAMLPEMHDSLKIGYSGEQLEWCKKNEQQMWTYLVENRMLYSTKRMDIIRYLNDGPYTNSFPLESPARTGIWIGWQIVRQYMEKHPEITLSELMENENYQEILNASRYFPE